MFSLKDLGTTGDLKALRKLGLMPRHRWFGDAENLSISCFLTRGKNAGVTHGGFDPTQTKIISSQILYLSL